MIEYVNSLNLNEIIFFVGLFLSLVITIGFSFLSSINSGAKSVRDLFYGAIIGFVTQWIAIIYLTFIISMLIVLVSLLTS